MSLRVYFARDPITETTRWRVLGLSSQSTSTGVCHVPSRSFPSATGIVIEGPSNEALRWACPFLS